MSGNSFITRNPSFLCVWAGQILSQSGGRMYQIAMVWWILSIATAGAGKLVGLFMVMAALPALLFVRRIGATIDRRPSQRILVVCDLTAAAVIAAVAALLARGWLTLPVAYAAGFLSAALQAFIDPTLNKAVNDVVEKSDVERAVSLLASTQSLANFAGAVMGAMLISKLGVAGTSALAALGYLVSSSATAVARFRAAPGGPAAPKSPAEPATKAGWAILDGQEVLKRILIGFGLINFFATPTLVVLPLYVKKTLHAGADTLGTLEAALWVGLIGGTLLAGSIPVGRSRIRLGAICIAVMGMGLAVPGVVASVGAYLGALVVAGFALGVNNVKFIALFQEVVDPEIKGRFFALMSAVVGASFPVAYFLFGAMTDYVPPPVVCLIQGTGVIATAVFFASLAVRERELAAS